VPATTRWWLLAGGAAIIVVAVGLGLAMPRRFLAAEDLALLRHVLTTTERWDAPALATQAVTLTLEHEARSGGLLALLALGALADPRLTPATGSARAAAIALAALALFLGNPWLAVDDPQGLGFRLRLVAFVPLGMVAAIVAGAAWRGLGYLEGRWRDAPTAAMRTAALAALAVAIVVRAPAERTEGRVQAHPAMVAAVMALDGVIPADAVAIVPERHILFMVAWYTRAQVALRPDLVPPARRRRVMPLAFIRDGSPLDALLIEARGQPGLVPPRGTHPSHPNGLVVVEEPTWEWILARLPAGDRKRLVAWPTI
jgi:hypothetical protein